MKHDLFVLLKWKGDLWMAKKAVLDEAQHIRAMLKKIFKQYRRMNASIRRALAEIGITVVEGRKHYKLYYNNDDRYCFPLPKTPSGSRTGATAVSRIYNSLILPQFV